MSAAENVELIRSLPLNGTVELFGPQAGGFGVIP